ncbi:hypothetical protein L1987_48177 [Smallanthus sonchifolius]|uniref:Uncharacterized protein n=1 Tax=Smallanthus sonchifolius TaxID=185202 RepID=A0ACB9FRB2_9ASTR|nr:hypothetical protein L1987_48177 [Smallanthus sonchifolius]
MRITYEFILIIALQLIGILDLYLAENHYKRFRSFNRICANLIRIERKKCAHNSLNDAELQRHLHAQGGLQAEGIFKVNGDNGQEEQIREQLNTGEVPEDIDVHNLACLIKFAYKH